MHEDKKETRNNIKEGEEEVSVSSPSPSPSQTLEELECHTSGINTMSLTGSDIKSQSSLRETLAVLLYMVDQ